MSVQGVLLLPTSVPLGQPLECTTAQNPDPELNSLFVRRYCQLYCTALYCTVLYRYCQYQLPPLVLYLPLLLLAATATLVIVDRPFVLQVLYCTALHCTVLYC